MDFDNAPWWASKWCYYFAGVGFVSIVVGIMGLVYSKKLGTELAIAYFLASLIQAATMFTMFWMCRASLAK